MFFLNNSSPLTQCICINLSVFYCHYVHFSLKIVFFLLRKHFVSHCSRSCQGISHYNKNAATKLSWMVGKYIQNIYRGSKYSSYSICEVLIIFKCIFYCDIYIFHIFNFQIISMVLAQKKILLYILLSTNL